jgi:hypothetical protein
MTYWTRESYSPPWILATCGPALATGTAGDTALVTQHYIEMIIGRLLTDEEFRQQFLSTPHKALADLLERGTA